LKVKEVGRQKKRRIPELSRGKWGGQFITATKKLTVWGREFLPDKGQKKETPQHAHYTKLLCKQKKGKNKQGT